MIRFFVITALAMLSAHCLLFGCGADRNDDFPLERTDGSAGMVQDEGDDAATDQIDKEEIPTESFTFTNNEGEQETFKLEIAAGYDTRAKGLSGRKEIAEHGGMIFIYPNEAHRSFWMKGCLVAIDIIFIDADGTIVRMYEMPPEPLRHPGESELHYENRLRSYKSVRPAQFAIELKGGTLKRLTLKTGDVIEADWDRIAEHVKRDTWYR